MSEPFIGMIVMFAGNFAPRGWAFCDGQAMPVGQNAPLFQIIGTTYGGDGQVMFALPDMRSRAPVHAGQGTGLSNYFLGQPSGNENVTLTINQMPSHAHAITLNSTGTINAKGTAGNSRTPAGAIPAMEASGVTATYSTAATDQTMAAGAVTVAGTGTTSPQGGIQPVEILQPTLAVHFIIALDGVFPTT